MTGFTTTRRVAFSETDAAGLMHFARFFVWMEDCEHALLRSLGTSVHTDDDQGLRLFPRVAAHAEFKHPLRFEDEVNIRLSVRARSTRSVTYTFTFTRRGDDTPCAHGETTVVCARDHDGKITAVPIPADLADAFDALRETP